MARVVLDGVSKVYPNGYKAVEDLDLEIRDGEFLVLVGPSGCGKSTALRMVAGLEEISGGELRINDTVVNDVHPKDRDIAMVFQNYALYPHMTVADNIGFSLKLSKLPKAEIAERVAQAARTLDLTEQLDKKPGHLSGGQRQRVAMGRAIVRAPKAFLMDEPLSNLDAKLRVQMRAEIAGLQRELGVTTVYVTHDQVEAMTMGDRVAVLKRGLLQQVDTPQNLYDSPKNVFVAGFIGSPSMNLMKARLTKSGDSLMVVLGEQSIRLPDDVLSRRPGLAAYVDRDLVVGLRPEDISYAGLNPATGAEQRITSRATLIEALGSELIVHFPLAVEPFEIMDREHEGEDAIAPSTDEDGNHIYLARVSPRATARLGDPIELVLDTNRFHYFDPTDGSAIDARSAHATMEATV